MTDTEIADRLRTLIDTSAPALSADDVLRYRMPADKVRGPMPAKRRGLSPVLVFSYCAMALVLTVAILLGLSTHGGSTPSKITPATKGSAPRSSVPGRGPFADLAATPVGWSPVIYGNVQISVPSDWVVYEGQSCAGETGVVLAVPANESGCANAPDDAEIGDFVPPTTPYSLKANSSVNGIPVALEAGTGGSSEEVALSMFVDARGSLATEILGTLTYAPDYAAINYPTEISWGTRVPDPIVSAPVSWQTVTFGGITFRAPSTWIAEHASAWGGCPGNDMQPNVIDLNTAQTTFPPTCPAYLTDAQSWAPTNGVVVASGPALFGGNDHVPDTSGDQCVNLNTLRICIVPIPLDGGQRADVHLNMLTALVFRPGHSSPDEIEIGLAGSGQVADAIFESMRAASA